MTSANVSRRSMWATPRSRGAIAGLGLILLGAWGAVIPFVGPYFNYAYTPNTTWTWTAARGYLEVLPGAVAFAAGLILLVTANRVVGLFAGWVAAAAGAWFVLGPLLSPLWHGNVRLGTAIGTTTDVSMEQLGMFFGLGAAIMLVAGLALGRFSVVGVRDVARVEQQLAAAQVASAGVSAPSGVAGEQAVADQGVPVAPAGTGPEATYPAGTRTQSRHAWPHRNKTPVGY